MDKNTKPFNAIPLIKAKTYESLDGKLVKCVFGKDHNLGIFAVQDVESKEVYILDCVTTEEVSSDGK